jgi:3-mercaptopyruvate sulfurtransferase SseA
MVPFLQVIAIVVSLVLAVPAAPLLARPQVHTHGDEEASPKLRVGWAEFKKQYDAGTIVVVDVRETQSFEAGHIPGSRSIPLPEIEKQPLALKKIGKPIVFYCA